MVSQYKKFNNKPSYEFVNYLIEQYSIAKNSNALMISYEDISERPELVIKMIA